MTRRACGVSEAAIAAIPSSSRIAGRRDVDPDHHELLARGREHQRRGVRVVVDVRVELAQHPGVRERARAAHDHHGAIARERVGVLPQRQAEVRERADGEQVELAGRLAPEPDDLVGGVLARRAPGGRRGSRRRRGRRRRGRSRRDGAGPRAASRRRPPPARRRARRPRARSARCASRPPSSSCRARCRARRPRRRRAPPAARSRSRRRSPRPCRARRASCRAHPDLRAPRHAARARGW